VAGGPDAASFSGQPDVPRSMGGDSGQARNAEQAARAFQVARASRHSIAVVGYGEEEPDSDPNLDWHDDYGRRRTTHGGERNSDMTANPLWNVNPHPTVVCPSCGNISAEGTPVRWKCGRCGETQGHSDTSKEDERWLGEHGIQAAKRSVRAGLRASAAFVPAEALGDAEFRKGYLFARRWIPGSRLVSRGSARFEAGVYSGITDNEDARAQYEWQREHLLQGQRHAALRQRWEAHKAFTDQYVREAPDTLVRGIYVQAGTSVDLVTDGPGTSPDPAGSTPINGPGTPPPMGGLSDPAKSGGPSPYQGAPPGPSAPVAPDDVLGQPQEPPQPDGKPVGFSGPDYGTGLLAPQAPNKAAGPGYSNSAADEGNPHHKAAAFRAVVQSNLQHLRESARAS
jgi:hypothetical protein